MIDPFGRHITYLRVSVTDRCDFRCVYCMAEDMTFLPKAEVLSLEELERLCSAFVRRGVKKLRMTGGEPLVRKNVMSLFRSLGRHLESGALEELTLTTNGSQLAKYARELADIGVKRVNVSMDTLDATKFRELTRWGDLDQVMRGLDAAQNAGLAIKINAVALRGVNDMEFDNLIRWSHGRGMDLVLIEVMPMGEIGDQARLDQYLPLSMARADIARHFTLSETDYRTGGPARYFKVEETGGRLGFITPLTHNFCESCNRVRLTCTGTLFMCLGQEDAADLRAPLRVEVVRVQEQVIAVGGSEFEEPDRVGLVVQDSAGPHQVEALIAKRKLKRLLPADSGLRQTLHDEVHARPVARIRIPALVTHIAVLNQGVAVEAEHTHLRQLVESYGARFTMPEPGFLRARLETFTVKWERHGEFSRYSITQPNKLAMVDDRPDGTVRSLSRWTTPSSRLAKPDFSPPARYQSRSSSRICSPT